MCIFTGTYRVTARKQFFKEVILGFTLDIVYLLGMSYIQGLNNASSLKDQLSVKNFINDLPWVAYVPLFVKAVCLCMWPIEIFMFIAEMCRKQNAEH